MSDLLAQLTIGFTVALSGALLPGPLMAFTATRTLDIGPKAGPFAALGHISVEVTLIALASLGLHTLLDQRIFMTATGSLGAVLLVFFGFSLLTNIARTGKQTSSSSKTYHPFLGGILFSSLLNPSVLLWWMTVGLATITHSLAESGLAGASFWFAGHALADLGWYSGLSYSVYKGREVIGGTFYRGLILACGGLMIFFGVRFGVKYIPSLFF